MPFKCQKQFKGALQHSISDQKEFNGLENKEDSVRISFQDTFTKLMCSALCWSQEQPISPEAALTDKALFCKMARCLEYASVFTYSM